MITLAEALTLGRQLLSAGKFTEAGELYRRIVLEVPEVAEAWHWGGVAAYQAGYYPQAIELISEAIRLQQREPTYYNHLGAACRAMGDYSRAMECYRQAIAFHPQYAEAHNNLANLCRQQGELPEAIAGYERALRCKPEFPEALYNLGNIWHDMGRSAEALAVIERAVALKPDYAEALNALGCLYEQAGDLTAALNCFKQALQSNPLFAEAHVNMGNVLRSQRQYDAAIKCYQTAQRLQPNLVEAHNNLGNVYYEQKQYSAAATCYQKSLEINPNYAEGYYNLGNVFKEKKQLNEAVVHYQQALALNPQLTYAHHNLGSVLNMQERLDEALACYICTLELQPTHAEAHNNLGSVMQHLGRFQEAIEWYQKALQFSPENPDYRMNLATLKLLLGDWPASWRDYETRWQTKEFVGSLPKFPQPRWEKEALQGKTLLLVAEQGLGDELQFARFARIACEQGASVVLQVNPSLVKLLSGSLPEICVVGRGESLPSFDYWLPLMSMMHVLQINLNTIPQQVPYLLAKEELVAWWQNKLSRYPGFRIGIHWRGRGGIGKWRLRDLPLEMFASLANRPGVQLVNLQFGSLTPEEQSLLKEMNVLVFDEEIDRAAGAFMDTAAIMKNLDLVISSDTSVPHLAGALAVPTWLILPFVPDWRWLLTREDSPWYPTMRLFRQTQRGEWHNVFQNMVHALQRMLNRHS